MRIGQAEVEQHRDGLSLMGTSVRPMAGVGVFDRFEVPRRDSSNYRQTMTRWSLFESGSGYFWIASPDDPRAAQTESGRAYVRAHRHATAAGVDMHPLSQALQELAEVRPQYDALRALLGVGDSGATVHMLARVGFGANAEGPAPRRELAQLLRS